MKRKMNVIRMRLIFLAGGSLAILLWSFVCPEALRAAPVGAPSESLPKLVEQVRGILGYDVRTLAALGATTQQDEVIISTIREELLAAAPEVQTLLQRELHDPVKRTHSRPAGPQPPAFILDHNHRQVILAVLPDLPRKLTSVLEEGQRKPLDNQAANVGLEPPLSLLTGVNGQQRRRLREAQLKRDELLSESHDSDRDEVARRARGAFDAIVTQVLTDQQEAEYGALVRRMATKLVPLRAYEASHGHSVIP